MSSPSTVTLLCHHIIIIFVTIIVHQYQMHKFIDHNLWYTYFGRSIFHTDFTISPFLSFPMFFLGGVVVKRGFLITRSACSAMCGLELA